MKKLFIMVLAVATFFALAMAILSLCRVRFSAPEARAAAVVSISAGLLGLIPIVASRRKDPVGIFQLALIGTVLHLLGAIALSGAAVGLHLAEARTSFVLWILAGYWVSLVALVWQLRSSLLAISLVKVQQ